ncbi:MAG: DUF3604 domain-containing protein [Halioglobus sp.]
MPVTRNIVAAVTLLIAGCGDGRDSANPTGQVTCLANNPLRNVYFGDLHVHTAFSFDSYAFDVRNRPDDAYRFARGEAVTLPPLDATGHGMQSLQLERPLDFAAVTDHAEFLGEVNICLSPESPGYFAPLCETFRNNGPVGQTLMGITLTDPAPQRDAATCGDGERCLASARSVWEEIVDSATRYYDRSSDCAFTTFIGYEYTANTNASARHRNVIFANGNVPLPVSYIEEPTPQRLWAALRRNCIDAGIDCDVIAIPHNSNQSNGHTFAVEYPGAVSPADEREQAQQRAAIEPLVEIYQHKGDSECANGLNDPFGAPDELCDFEKLRLPPFDICGDTPGSGGVANSGCVSRLDFVRGALLEGLRERDRIGANPYQLGIIGSTDTHNGTPGAVVEGDWLGHRGNVDDEVSERLGSASFRAGPVFNPAGLAAVWAQENTRASLFAALKRREVYGTSGPRIVVRLFGGWEMPTDLCADANAVARADAAGVPMGARLPPPPTAATAPVFFVMAAQDAGTAARPGTPLQRIQIIKGWTMDGAAHQRVFDVAGDVHNGAAVNADCSLSGEGFASLCAVWTDPEFSFDQQAFYYARVVENPSCRWTALQCNAAAGNADLASCHDPNLVRVIQERAWTSPIWYETSRPVDIL